MCVGGSVGVLRNTEKFTQRKKERTDSKSVNLGPLPDWCQNSDHVALTIWLVCSCTGCGGFKVKLEMGLCTHPALCTISLHFWPCLCEIGAFLPHFGLSPTQNLGPSFNLRPRILNTQRIGLPQRGSTVVNTVVLKLQCIYFRIT